MKTVSRRDAFKVIAGVAVAGAIAGPAAAESLGLSAGETAPRPAMGDMPNVGASDAVAAVVSHIRSWDRRAYLYVDPSVRGVVALDVASLAIAAAAKAANRVLWIRYWGYEPAANNGAGAFAGVLLALDKADLQDATR